MAKHDSAKYAFFYLLSLVALVFVSISVGMIVFQIINKEIVDIINEYSGRYSDGQMKFAISAIIVSAPIYYLTSRQIYRSLYKGNLDKDAGVRRWLTYLILLVTVVVMLGWLIATINGFLEGEVTTKFILKALTAVAISGTIFSFYLYDIKREKVEGHKDKVLNIFTYGSLLVVLVVFVAAWFFVESPQNTRLKKIDDEIVSDLNNINYEVRDYYTLNEELPEQLSQTNLVKKSYMNPATGEHYEYEVVADDEYKICAEFLTSNMEDVEEEPYYGYREPHGVYRHDKGYECFSQKVTALHDSKMPPSPVLID